MTCYIDPESGEVYDHTGTKVGTISEWGQSWSGDFPTEALDVLREAMDGDQPSAYNQSLLVDMASENIEMGTPPA
jgi:hypothetical protein